MTFTRQPVSPPVDVDVLRAEIRAEVQAEEGVDFFALFWRRVL
jgi:sRNA-binding carbon storage regulator CsrA